MKSALVSALLTGLLLGLAGSPLAAQDQSAATDDSLTAAGLYAQAADPAAIASPPESAAQDVTVATEPASQPPAAEKFPPDQLEQLVAPIALYPDALLSQVLMASTYPLEVVEADRFMTSNPELKDAALDEALKDKDWDPSVKSLCKLPDVLKKMSENLDWTQDLGDAVLEQQTEVMDTVQRMRGLAYEAGNLKTSEQQVVTQQPDKIIVIESPEPEVIYVPTYSSTVVYGSTWGYPSYYYPPMYPYYPPGYGLISFGVGMAVGAAIWGGCNWGWGGSDIDIDINRYNEFNRNTNINADRDRMSGDRGGNKSGWQHDSSHRKGVNYKDSRTAQKYGGSAGSNRVTKDQARGRATSSASNRASASQRPSAGRDMATSKQSAGARPSGSSKPSAASRPSTGAKTSQASSRSRSGASSAYSGSRSPSADRMSSSRGASSRGAASYGGGSRGGMRGGGGGGRRR